MKANFNRLPSAIVVVGLIILLSLWLRANFPILAFGAAGHDDALFVKLGAAIGSGTWLGEYNNLTHAKGVGYPVFLVLNHALGLPLKFTEHAIYLAAALCISVQVGRIVAVRGASLLAFALLAFLPTAWSPGVGGRVIREGLYLSLSLLLLYVAARCFVEDKKASIVAEFKEKRLPLFLLGFVAGYYWLTREEGIWLLPSIVLLCAYWFWSRRESFVSYRHVAAFLCVPMLSMALVVGTVDALNYFKYGTFRNNDFRTADFLAGYGALARIKQDKWQRYVVFPRDARERAYRFSAAARELKPAFEGPMGEWWRKVGCEQTRTDPCPEILSGWFMWALRDAVASAGHYRSASAAQAFYRRLAEEIDQGCREHPGECLPYRETMVPPWRDEYLADTLQAASGVFKTLITLDGAQIGVGASFGTPKQLAVFELATNGPLAPHESVKPDPELVSPRDKLRMGLAGALAKGEKAIAEFGIPGALIGWLAWVALAFRRRRLQPALVLATAMVAALASRVTLLGFLDATSIPSNNMLYLSPVLPIALMLIPTVLFGILSFRNIDNCAPPKPPSI